MRIDVNGVVPEKRKIAEKELRDYFGNLAHCGDISVIEIVVSSNFDETVDMILKERLGTRLPYASKRHQVVVAAKTVPFSRDGKIAFAIIFNGTVFGSWEEQQHLSRMMTFAHESVHIIGDKALYCDIGAGAFFSEPATVEEVFFRLAYDIWVDYRAERYPIELFKGEAKGLDSIVTATYESREGYVNSFVESLRTFPEFLRRSIDDFRNWKMTMNDFWPKVYLRLRETLILAAFTAAHSDATGQIRPQLGEVRREESYSFFFVQWQEIEENLRALHLTEKPYDRAILRAIAGNLQNLFKSCGMEFSNIKEGIYIAVRPVC